MEDVLPSVDRISDLPNEVLIHILSFMSTKEVAPTFMLSKRWNNIWAALPCLKFDFAEFLPEDDQLSEVGNAKFIGFVDGVLRRRGTTPIDKFELMYGSEEISPHPAVGWVDHIAVNCKPRGLRLHILVEDYNFCIPSSAFSCASLEEMELMLSSEDRDLFLPEKINLPSLKKFTLSGAMLDNDFFEQLFSTSCLLEKLVLDSCELGLASKLLQISSSTLQHFALRYCIQCADVHIDAPSLIYLDIQSNGNGRIYLKNLRSLVDAQVKIYGPDMYSSNISGCLKYVGALANGTTLDLTLTSDVMKEILDKEFNFPTFVNLKTLVIGKWCMVNDFDLVAAFLGHSPNLQMLKLFHTRSDGSNLEQIASSELFLKDYLHTVVIDTGSANAALDLDFLHLHDEDEAAGKAKNESVDLLVKQLRAHVRTIGEIRIMKPQSFQFNFDDIFMDL